MKAMDPFVRCLEAEALPTSSACPAKRTPSTRALEEAFAQDRRAVIALPVDYAENRKLTKRLGEIECPI